jgi:hypothetical protein
MEAGDGGCLPSGRGYSSLSTDHNADEASDVEVDAKDAGALFVLESKGTVPQP